MQLPEFNAMLVFEYGWFVLYANGTVYYCEKEVGSRPANAFETFMVRALYNLDPSQFQTDNRKAHNVQ